MVRAAVQCVVVAIAAAFLAVSFLFWCAVGAVPGTLVLSKLGFSLAWSALIAAAVCGVPVALYALRRGREAPPDAARQPESAEPVPEAPPPPPPERRMHFVRFEELDAEEAALEARLEDVRRRKRALEELACEPDPLDDAWFTDDRA